MRKRREERTQIGFRDIAVGKDAELSGTTVGKGIQVHFYASGKLCSRHLQEERGKRKVMGSEEYGTSEVVDDKTATLLQVGGT